MSRSFITLAFRYFRNHRMYSLINLFGLIIGFSSCMIVAAIIYNALSYDRQWANSKDLYRIMAAREGGMTGDRNISTLTGLGPAIMHNFPAVAEYCRLRNIDMNLSTSGPDDGVWTNCLTADPTIFKLLDIPVLNGNPARLVDGYPNLVISQKLKEQLFHHTDPIGKIVTRTSDYSMPYEGKKRQYIITGVMTNMPANSHFFADALLLDTPWPGEDDLNSSFGTVLPQYILVKPGTDMASFTARINRWYRHLLGENSRSVLFFQPVTDIHLHPETGNDPDTSGSLHNIYIYLILAGLIISIASFNYINLSLAIAIKRIPDVGIRSVLGATRFQIILQSLFESLVYFLIAFPSASLLFILCLRPAATFVGHPLTLNIGQGIVLISLCGLFLLIITITSGYYSARQLASVNPALTVRGNITKFANTGLIKKILIVGQFTIAIVLFIFIATVSKQLKFMNQKDLGFDKDNLLYIDNNNWDTKSQAFKQGLLQIAGVTGVSISTWNPALGQGYMSAEVDDIKDSAQKVRIWYISGDHDLVSTLKLELIDGDSHRDQPPDTAVDTPPVLITEYTAKRFGIKSLNEPNPVLRGKPVGILKNFNNGSLRYPATPCVINVLPSPTRGYILIRTTGRTNPQLPDRLRRLWRQFYPEKLLQFNWISDSLALQYAEEVRLQKCFSVLAFLSLLLTLLGLFGQVAYSIDQRVKEIGIRKALGASVSGIVFLISGTYIKLIGIAIAIASPTALWISSAWLREYANRIDLSWTTFVAVWLLILSVTILTLALTSVRSAAQRPAIALRVE